MYDEVEYFRSHDHQMFNYPFVHRKNKLGTYRFNSAKSEDGDYEYPSDTIRF